MAMRAASRLVAYITASRVPPRSRRLPLDRRASMGVSFSSDSVRNSDSKDRDTSDMSAAETPAPPTVQKSESEWQAILSPEQFRILRQKGTEGPHTGAYNSHSSDGVYSCAGCSAPLYKSTTKFDSGCGWPAFYEGLPGAINRREDRSLRSVRTEITCAACGGHLGHVFKGEGYGTPTDERHCVNSVSLKFADG